MLWTIVLLLPSLVAATGDGNIRLMEEEITAAIKACVIKDGEGNRQKREESYEDPYKQMPRIDSGSKFETNQYNHERRNSNDTKEQIHVLNATDYDYAGYGNGNVGEKYVNTIPRPALGNNNDTSGNRSKRNEPLLNKDGTDQCLSQCVFANLQVVDTRGIPREAELWNKVQSSVTSQQSRAALRDQIRACFQELQSEAEDNGCSYSNKLERCLMLRFSDRDELSSRSSNTQS